MTIQHRHPLIPNYSAVLQHHMDPFVWLSDPYAWQSHCLEQQLPVFNEHPIINFNIAISVPRQCGLSTYIAMLRTRLHRRRITLVEVRNRNIGYRATEIGEIVFYCGVSWANTLPDDIVWNQVVFVETTEMPRGQ